MKLWTLLQDILPICPSIEDTNIEQVTDRSEKAQSRSLLVCIKGARFDGHDFAMQAYENGCRHFVAERTLDLPKDATVFLTSNTRKSLALLACRFFGDPSHQMTLIAITGTKGKTTTAQLLSHILNHSSIPCGYIGTNGIIYGDVKKSSLNTTPDPLTLQKTLCEMLETGIKCAVVEVSSQALYQYRADGMRFACGMFTNLSPDHIGTNEHPSLEHYMDCKLRLFSEFDIPTVICNADDPFSERIADCAPNVKRITCSTQGADADWKATGILPTFSQERMGISFTAQTKAESIAVSLPLAGEINAANALLAMACANTLFHISAYTSAESLKTAAVMGRSEIIALPNGAYVVIDYAHNGASLTQLLTTLRAYSPARLICLFGSIGGRAQIRRRELAKAAISLCDLSVLTSDNPAFEDPEAIIDEIAQIFEEQNKPYLRCADRAEAIRQAIALTQQDDILVLAGKGHENYQLIKDQKIPFCEKAIVIETCLQKQR